MKQKRLLSVFLTICMVLTLLPAAALAVADGDITVTAFKELPIEVQQQSVEAGTALERLNLPAKLKATGTAEKPVDSDLAGDTAPDVTAAITIEAVTWELTADKNSGNTTYDEAAEIGAYVFTPILPRGYTLAEGVSQPEIQVIVGRVNTLIGETGGFTVTGGTLGTSYKYESNTLTILNSDPLTISGTTTADKIVVASGITADITLDGVDI